MYAFLKLLSFLKKQICISPNSNTYCQAFVVLPPALSSCARCANPPICDVSQTSSTTFCKVLMYPPKMNFLFRMFFCASASTYHIYILTNIKYF